MNNLIYSLQINYINDSKLNVSICKKMNDEGLEINSIQVGDICITEETLNGRIISGRYDNQNYYCGYRYNYDKINDEYLVNTNKDISLENTISLINKTKLQSDFLSTKTIINPILRNDYRIYSLTNGVLNIIKTVSAETEKKEKHIFEENIYLSKTREEKSFSEKQKERIYKINDISILEYDINDINLKILIEIINQNPNSYKDLMRLKKHIQKTTPEHTL